MPPGRKHPSYSGAGEFEGVNKVMVPPAGHWAPHSYVHMVLWALNHSFIMESELNTHAHCWTFVDIANIDLLRMTCWTLAKDWRNLRWNRVEKYFKLGVKRVNANCNFLMRVNAKALRSSVKCLFCTNWYEFTKFNTNKLPWSQDLKKITTYPKWTTIFEKKGNTNCKKSSHVHDFCDLFPSRLSFHRKFISVS